MKLVIFRSHSNTKSSVKESRQASCEDLHDDERITLNSELATDSLVSDMEIIHLFAVIFSLIDIFKTNFKNI